jgi:hypothetical protein
VRAALIVWDGVHILDDVLAMGPAARADDWMLLGNCVGDIVSRVAIDDDREKKEEEEGVVAGTRAAVNASSTADLQQQQQQPQQL